MARYTEKIKQKYRETKEKSLLVYLILRILVIVCMTLQIIRGDWNMPFYVFYHYYYLQYLLL